MQVSLEYRVPPSQILDTWTEEDYNLVCLYLAQHGTTRQVTSMQYLDMLALHFYAYGGKRFDPQKFTYEYRTGKE